MSVDLFSYVPPAKAFDGATYDPKRDHARLAGQLSEVFQSMKDGRSRTLREIADMVCGSEASVSARLRDLRKEKYGSHVIERKHISRGLFSYRLVVRA